MRASSFLIGFILLGGILISINSCCKDKCKAAILADLTSEVIGALPIETISNTQTARTVRILNNFINDGTNNLVENNCNCDNVNTTNSQTSRWKIHFSDNPNATFNEIISTTDTIVDVYKNKLASCKRDTTGIGLDLLYTGIYVIENLLDADSGTPERNENNNLANTGKYSMPTIEKNKQLYGNNYSYAVIRVTELPIRNNNKPAFRVIEKF